MSIFELAVKEFKEAKSIKHKVLIVTKTLSSFVFLMISFSLTISEISRLINNLDTSPNKQYYIVESVVLFASLAIVIISNTLLKHYYSKNDTKVTLDKK